MARFADVMVPMFSLLQSQLGGFICLSVSVVVAVLLIVGRGRRRDCPVCHQRNPGHANYCARCGHAFHA